MKFNCSAHNQVLLEQLHSSSGLLFMAASRLQKQSRGAGAQPALLASSPQLTCLVISLQPGSHRQAWAEVNHRKRLALRRKQEALFLFFSLLPGFFNDLRSRMRGSRRQLEAMIITYLTTYLKPAPPLLSLLNETNFPIIYVSLNLPSIPSIVSVLFIIRRTEEFVDTISSAPHRFNNYIYETPESLCSQLF